MNDNKETRKMKKITTLFGILILVVLTACSTSGGEDPAVAAQAQSANTVSSTQLIENDEGALQPVQSGDTAAGGEAETTSGEVQSGNTESSTQLIDSYTDALPVQTQLALGTLLLEDGELAVGSDQATALLPLWRFVQNLAESSTAADAEISAIVNQIQDDMTAEQITAITDMQLTQESIRSLVQDGSIAIERGDVKSGATGATAGGGAPGGGGGGPLGGQADLSQLATRQAAHGSDGNDRLSQAVANAVIQLLEVKQSS
jgi:hypothetical protein